MKAIWTSDEIHSILKKASERTGRPISQIISMLVTKELNWINDADKINEWFKGGKNVNN